MSRHISGPHIRQRSPGHAKPRPDHLRQEIMHLHPHIDWFLPGPRMGQEIRGEDRKELPPRRAPSTILWEGRNCRHLHRPRGHDSHKDPRPPHRCLLHGPSKTGPIQRKQRQITTHHGLQRKEPRLRLVQVVAGRAQRLSIFSTLRHHWE
jgi:hypothetical protein